MKEKIFENINNYITMFNEKKVLQYLKDTNQDKKIIKDANNIIEGKIVYNAHWNMEPCIQVYKISNKDIWKDTPNGDNEWCYMLNRMEYMDKLIIAYYLTKKEKYIEVWKNIVEKWNNDNLAIIKKNQRNKKIFFRVINKVFHIKNNDISTRTLDTAIRCIYLMQGLIHLYNLKFLNNEEVIELQKKINVELKYLKKMYTSFADTSNWGIIETTSILSCLIIQGKQNSRLYKWAMKKLELQLKLQIIENEGHIENSPMYHNQVLISLLTLIYWSDFFKADIPEKIKDKAKTLAEYTYNIATPDNMQIELGDSDRTEISDIMYLSFLILKDRKYLCKIREHIEYKYVFYFNNIHDIDTRLHKKKENFNIMQYERLGNIVVKNNLKGDYLFISNSEIPFQEKLKKLNGHKHADVGHFILYMNEKPFIIDSGRYTYKNNEDRKYFKSEYAHNTIIIDDKPLCEVNDSWNYHRYANSIKNSVVDNKDFKEITIEYSDSGEIKRNIIKRMFLIFRNGVIFVIDHVTCDGKHFLDKYFHYDKNVKIEEKDEYTKLINENIEVLIEHINYDKKTLKDTKNSIMYNIKEDNMTEILNKKFLNEATSYEIISSDKNIEVVDTKFYYGRKFCIEDNNYIVFLKKENIDNNNREYFQKYKLEGLINIICEDKNTGKYKKIN